MPCGMFRRAPKNLKGEKLQFSPVCGPKFDILSLNIPQCEGNRKLENNRVTLRLGYDVHTEYGGGPITHC